MRKKREQKQKIMRKAMLNGELKNETKIKNSKEPVAYMQKKKMNATNSKELGNDQ